MRMQRIVSFLLLWFLPLAALADGRVFPPLAVPAHINIPDQRALICFSNGTERLVVETRFTGSGTNFAWVIPLPGQPIIDEATTGLFPTLGYLFRPRIIHNVPRFYLAIMIAIGLIYLFPCLRKYASADFIIFLFLFVGFLATCLLPALSAGQTKGVAASSSEAVSILDRKIVGTYKTTTIASRDPKALQAWLSENGYAAPTNTIPVIADYVKDGWIFVVTKVRRDRPDSETSTPHPLSFTFKTDKPVYPMRLTGADNGPLSVELYVFGSSRVRAAHFKAASCSQPSIVHPLLHQWTAGLPVATKLTAALSPAAMRNDVWLNWTPFEEKENRLFSRQGALTVALNWGTGLFAVSFLGAWFLAFASETQKLKLPRRIGVMTIVCAILVGLIYLALPKIEVKLLKDPSFIYSRQQQLALQIALDDLAPKTTSEARKELQELLSSPTNAAAYHLQDWDNYLIGGQIREEDSPGNYLLRETNNQLQLVTIQTDGGEGIAGTWNLPAKH